jgi:hypothetical protein
MAMFEMELTKHRNKTEAKSGEKNFLEWCDKNGLGLEGFSPCVASDKVWKGKPVTFFIASYGFYQVQDGWMLYIAYRGDVVNHIRQHTWRWDGSKANLASYKLNEWLNI